MMGLNESTEKINGFVENPDEGTSSVNEAETNSSVVEEKNAANKKLKVICITGASVLLVAIVCVMMYVKNPLRIFEKAYEIGDLQTTADSYDDMKQSQKDKAIAIVLEDCNAMFEAYNQGELSYDETKLYFSWMDDVVNSESEELTELISSLEKLKVSKDTFELATKDLKTLKSETANSDNCTEVYKQVMNSLSGVSENDANFEKVEGLREDAEKAYVNNMIAIAEQILSTKDYESAPSVIEKALEVLPENENLLSARVSIVENGVVKKEQEKKDAEALTLKVLKDILGEATAGKMLSTIAPRTLVDKEFVGVKLFTIGEDAQWGLLICDDDNCKLYMDDGEAYIPIVNENGAISYSISADGNLIIKVTNEYIGWRSVDGSNENGNVKRTYYTISSADKVVSETFKRDKTVKQGTATRVYYVGSTKISEEEFYQREEGYKENVWTDVTVVTGDMRSDYEVCINTAESVSVTLAELDALIAERTN